MIFSARIEKGLESKIQYGIRLTTRTPFAPIKFGVFYTYVRGFGRVRGLFFTSNNRLHIAETCGFCIIFVDLLCFCDTISNKDTNKGKIFLAW